MRRNESSHTNLNLIIQLLRFWNKLKYLKKIGICFLFLYYSCQENVEYIPKKNAEISHKSYSLFVNKLKEAYKNGNDYQIAFQLSNLKYKGPLTYQHLQKAIDTDTAICNEIFYTMMIAKESSFYQNIYKNDTVVFLNAFNYCLKKNGIDSYKLFYEDYISGIPAVQGCLIEIDSAIWDRNLISFLKVIYNDDQKYRKLVVRKNNSEKETEYYNSLIQKVDSINLQRVDSLLRKRGFPGFNIISPDQHKTIFLVLHHQSEKSIRLKYRSIVEKYYPKIF